MHSEEVFRKAIEASPVGIVMIDAAGHIVLANPETERLFGYAAGELIGQTIDILVPDAIRARHAHLRVKFADGPKMRSGKARAFKGRRKDGSEFSVEIGLNPIQTDDGPLVLGSIVDVSEILRIGRLQDEFIATISHELRTPLTSIIGALGLLVMNGRTTLPAAALRLLAIAQSNAQRLVRLVNSILDIEKIDSGKAVFVLKCVETSGLIAQAIEANRAAADCVGVRLRFDAATGPSEARADADWLLQVFVNLLSNAIKFSPPNGEVVIAIENRPGFVRVSVRDHGGGVPDSFKARIFEKFAQADNSDTRAKGGAGLGLNIAKQIVSRLGGTVGVADAPDGGAIFHVDLPAWEPVPSQSTAA
jgi:PAS domain S-box-containing protein